MHGQARPKDFLFFYFGLCIFLVCFVFDIFQQFTFIIKQKEQHTNLNISNNTN